MEAWILCGESMFKASVLHVGKHSIDWPLILFSFVWILEFMPWLWLMQNFFEICKREKRHQPHHSNPKPSNWPRGKTAQWEKQHKANAHFTLTWCVARQAAIFATCYVICCSAVGLFPFSFGWTCESVFLWTPDVNIVPATPSQVPIGLAPVSALQAGLIKPSSIKRRAVERPQMASAVLVNKWSSPESRRSHWTHRKKKEAEIISPHTYTRTHPHTRTLPADEQTWLDVSQWCGPLKVEINNHVNHVTSSFL